MAPLRTEPTGWTRSGKPIPTRPGVRPTLPPPTATKPVDGLAAPTASTSEIVSARPVAPQYSLTTETEIVGAEADALWSLYEATMGPLDQVAAMTHLEPRDLMMQRFADPGITKVVGWDGDEPVGLGLITNDFALVGEISPDFFANKFPDHAGAQLDLLRHGRTGQTNTARQDDVLADLHRNVADPSRVGGVLIFDTCKFNRDNFGADDIIGHIAANFPNSNWSVIDQQTWYVAELPEPIR